MDQKEPNQTLKNHILKASINQVNKDEVEPRPTHMDFKVAPLVVSHCIGFFILSYSSLSDNILFKPIVFAV